MSPEDKHKAISNEMAEGAKRLKKVSEVWDYAERFPCPPAGQLILAALNYFSEKKMINGRRDGKGIYERFSLGHGRLTKDKGLEGGPTRLPNGKRAPVWDILIGIRFYTEKIWPIKHSLAYGERINNKKKYGVEDPREIVYEFLELLFNERRK